MSSSSSSSNNNNNNRNNSRRRCCSRRTSSSSSNSQPYTRMRSRASPTCPLTTASSHMSLRRVLSLFRPAPSSFPPKRTSKSSLLSRTIITGSSMGRSRVAPTDNGSLTSSNRQCLSRRRRGESREILHPRQLLRRLLSFLRLRSRRPCSTRACCKMYSQRTKGKEGVQRKDGKREGRRRRSAWR